MTIELTGETEAFVLRAAEESGMTPAEVVAGMLNQAVWPDGLESDPEEQRVVAERLAEADRNDSWISEEEMDEKVKRMITR